MSTSQIAPEKLVIENIRSLLSARRINAKDLAIWCGHRKAWISKVLSGDRGIPVRELGKIADFFGLTVAELFSPGISPLFERRRRNRRLPVDRRSGADRRTGKAGVARPPAIPVAPTIAAVADRVRRVVAVAGVDGKDGIDGKGYQAPRTPGI
jgi:hypothetical protein